MKNIFRTVLLTALACLLCFSCTNINDPETLKAEQFTVNEMKVEGFYVEGLDASYDGKAVELVYVTKDAETVIGESSIVADNSKVYKSGSTKIKFNNPELIKEKGTFYLKLEGGDKVQVLNEKMEMVNADLGIISSAYGTKEDGLAKKMVVVKAASIVSKSIPATFAWEDAKNVNEPKLRMFICGDFTEWSWKEENEMTLEDGDIFTFEITEKEGIAFKISAVLAWQDDANWTTASEITVGGDYAEMQVGPGKGNTEVKNMEPDKTYKIY